MANSTGINRTGSTGDHGRGENRKKGLMNNPKTLNLMRKISIAGVGLLVILLVFLFLYQTMTTSIDTVDAGPKPGDPFFENQTVYYLKTVDSNKVFPSIINLMKNLKMDNKKTAENEFKKLNLEKNDRDEDTKQYFFYNADDEVYTFSVSYQKEEVVPKPVSVKIKILEGQNPTKFWGVYLLERKTAKNNAKEFLYSFKYLEGKYGATIISRYFGNNLSEKPFDTIIENIVNGIAETINKNPKDAAKNGPNLIFKLNLLGHNDQETGTSAQIDFPLFHDKEKSINVSKENETTRISDSIDIYMITENRKVSLENELKTELTELFPVNEKRSELRRKIDIFKYDQRIADSPSNSLQEKVADRINKAISDSDMGTDSFDAWKKSFDSKGAGVTLAEFKTYKEERLNQIEEQPKKSSYYYKMIYIGIVIIVLLGTYFWLGHKIKRPVKGEMKEQQIPGEPSDSAGKGETGSHKGNKEIEDQPEDRKNKGKTPENSGQDVIEEPSSIKELKEKLKKIGKLVNKLKIDTYSHSSMGIATELQDNFRCAENTITGILDAKTIGSEFLISEVRKIQENLKNIEKDKTMTYFIDDLKKIETDLLALEKSGFPGKIESGRKDYDQDKKPFTAYSASNEQMRLKTEADTQQFEKDGKEILKTLKDIKNFGRNLLKIFFKGKEKKEIEYFLVETLKAPTENKGLIQKILEAFSRLEKKVDEIAKEGKDASILYPVIDFLNKELDFKVKKSNVLEVIQKVREEPKFSKEYRFCAIALYDRLSKLEDKYINKWFWNLIKTSFWDKLNSYIDAFRIRDDGTKTIYDIFLNQKIPLKAIEPKHIKRMVEQLHWFHIWDGLIRMSDFFNAYFDDKMDDIKFSLGLYSQTIKEILKEWGYEIYEEKPLNLISTEDKKKKNFEPIDKSYINNSYLKELFREDNKQLIEAMSKIPYGSELVIFVERLGLTDKLAGPPLEIIKLRFGAYNQGTLSAHLSSKPSTPETNTKKD